jgi:hypothetical protein
VGPHATYSRDFRLEWRSREEAKGAADTLVRRPSVGADTCGFEWGRLSVRALERMRKLKFHPCRLEVDEEPNEKAWGRSDGMEGRWR